jgi:hypothetical protein
MKLLETIPVPRHGRPAGLIELFHGDLTRMPPEHAVDVLAVSAFANDYTPVSGTLIGALRDCGISVDQLARDKEVDLRDAFSCWLSREITPRRPGGEARRVLCFEPHWRGTVKNPGRFERPAEAVEELYQGLLPFTGEKWKLRRVAMPLLAAGNIGATVEEMAEPLVEEAIRCMQLYPLECVKLVCLYEDDAKRARAVFRRIKERHALFDVFISYSQHDAAAVDAFVERLRQRQPLLSLFQDRPVLQGGDLLDQRIHQALRSCRFFVPFYSPHYFRSDWCKDEFGMALARRQIDGRPWLFPVLLAPIEGGVPELLGKLLYQDCTRGPGPLLDNVLSACEEFLRFATGA